MAKILFAVLAIALTAGLLYTQHLSLDVASDLLKFFAPPK